MEAIPGRHIEQFQKTYRSLAYVALAGMTLLISDMRQAYSMTAPSKSPIIDTTIHPSPKNILITDGMISSDDLSHYQEHGLRQLYTYPLFDMAAYEATTEKVQDDMKNDRNIHAIYHSNFHPIVDGAAVVFTQTEQETREGWGNIMDAVGITTLATLYHVDVSNSEICFIDTAFDTSHPALSTHIVHEECNSSETEDIASLCTGDPHPASDGNCGGECTHGTMTASAGVMNSTVNVSLFKTASAFGGDTPGLKDVDILAGFHGCLQRKLDGHHVVAANLSASHYSTFSKACNDVESAKPYAQAFKKMIGHGISVVISSGNFSEKNEVGIPACIVGDPEPLADGIFAVSSSTFKQGEGSSIAGFTNRSALLTSIFAPGTDIPVATTGGYFATASGTSFSAPITSLSLAYLDTVLTHLSPGEKEQLIRSGALKLNDNGEAFSVLNLAGSVRGKSSINISELFIPAVVDY